MSRLFIKPKLLKGNAGESTCKNLEVARAQVRNQERNPGYVEASGNPAFNSMAFQISLACSVNDLCQHLSLPMFATFSSGNLFAVILSVRIHSIQRESPSNCWDPAAPARNNIFYPLWIWVTQYHSTVHLFTNIYIIYIQPFIFQQHLTDSVTKQQCQTPVTVTSSDHQPADSLSHVDLCALKSIMSNTTPSIQLHCCWLISDKPWRSKKTSVFGIIGVSVWLYSSPW